MRALFLALVLAGCGSLGDTNTYLGTGTVELSTGATTPLPELFLACPFDDGDLELLSWTATPVQAGCDITFETGSNWSSNYELRPTACPPDARGVYAVPTSGGIEISALIDPFSDRVIDFVNFRVAGDYRTRASDGTEQVLATWSVQFTGQERP